MVNLDGEWVDGVEADLDRYDRAFPGRFVAFVHVDWRDCVNAGWPDRMAASLADSARRGADGPKV